jgi:hypothetical protein
LLSNIESRQALVCMFLAMLEPRAAAGRATVAGTHVRRILIRKHVGFEAIMNEQAAVRDDWSNWLIADGW